MDLKVSNHVFSAQTAYQKIEIIDNPFFGRVLLLDDLIQLTERDEYIYHEMISHVPICLNDNPNMEVLIIGGGDGGVLREVLKHSRVKAVTLVEIDQVVIECCKEYLPQISKRSFDDQRVTLVYQDGLEFLKSSTSTYDVIICDSTEDFGPGEVLFSLDFYKLCRKSLNLNGMLVLQSGVPFCNPEKSASVFKKLKLLFKEVAVYSFCVPTYVGGLMTCTIATENFPEVSTTQLAYRMDMMYGKTRYYNAGIHMSCFHLPEDIKYILK